jgi:aldehyde:ferredoxin oxidoreductase
MRLRRVLVADLGRRRADFEPLPPEDRRYIGGAALGARLLERYGEAAWILGIGPLTGSPASPRPQAVVTHISPLTGGISDSVVSHPLALALASGATAALVLLGRSEAPLWLRLDGDGVRFEDARPLWGMNLTETVSILRSTHGCGALAAGPAAEHQVPYASLGAAGHSAGRGGAGAALAARGVKAIACLETVEGAGGARGSRQEAGDDAPGGASGGAAERLRRLNALAALPTRNFSERTFAAADALAAQMEEIGSSRRLPYEAAFAFGPLLGIADARAVLRCLEACDRLGLDVISTGGALAWGIESTGRGALDGALPCFGEAGPLEGWIEAIAYRRDAGDLLAYGVRRASEILGKGSSAWAMHVHGMEIPGYDPRAFPTMALGYSISSRGACHVRSGAYQADLDDPLPSPADAAAVARRAAEFEDRSTLLDSLLFSRSWRASLGDIFEGAARLLREAGEADLADPEELRWTMGRVSDLRRRINLAQGWTPAEDTLPERLLSSEPRLPCWVRSYYSLRGWDPEGRPPAAPPRDR